MFKPTMKPNHSQSDLSSVSSYFEQAENHYKPPPPIKIIPATASIHPFLGTNNDFSPKEFIALCKDLIKESFFTEDAGKISLICFRLVLGSRALNSMQSSAFSLTDTGSDYEQFKRNFQKVFSDSGRGSLVK